MSPNGPMPLFISLAPTTSTTTTSNSTAADSSTTRPLVPTTNTETATNSSAETKNANLTSSNSINLNEQLKKCSSLDKSSIAHDQSSRNQENKQVRTGLLFK